MGKAIEHIEVDIDLDERLPLHRIMWRVQDWFVVAVILLIVAGIAGFFGDGWLSHTGKTKGDITVSYPYFSRYGNEVSMTVQGSVREVRIPDQYLRHFKLTRVVPQPDRQSLSGGNAVFTVASDAPGTVRFYWLPNETGSVEASLEIDARTFDISQFTYP